MTEVLNHTGHSLLFDGVLHWCFLIAVASFFIGLTWVIVRVIIPLRRLVRETASIAEGILPTFDQPISALPEIEQLRQSLHYMIGAIKKAQEGETTYRNALTDSQENERKRIAREIHDDTIQSLVLVGHSMERAMGTIQEASSEGSTVRHLETARTQLIQAVDNLRHMIANLRPTILDELGLAAAIEVLCENHPSLEFSLVGDVYGLDQSHELAVFRAAQEAIHNAERHAQAKRIVTTLTYSDAAVTLEVSDDGVGFQIPKHLQELSVGGHYGLVGIRERIQHLGGQMNLISDLAAGTRITVKVPS